MNLGISTVYFSRKILKREITWQQIKSIIYELEIDSVELNSDIPLDWMNEIYEDIKNQKIKVLSLHNFCPAVENIPPNKYGFNVFSLNAADETERELAIKYTLRTIDYANHLNAKAVVLHLGEILTEPTGMEFYRYTLEYGINSKLFLKYKNSLITTRNSNKNKYFELLYRSLDKIIPYAEQKKVNLAMETRFFSDEIPNFEEIKEIKEHYNSNYLFYWHDFGHAEIQKKLGFSEGHEKYFTRYKDILKGYHIHNLLNLQDHFSPHIGEINFNELLKYDDDKVYILEIHSKEKLNNLKEGINFVKNLLEKKSYERVS